jgi:hypothetical protein
MNNENAELEFILESVPEGAVDDTPNESGKLILKNASGTGKASNYVSVDPEIILARIVEHTSGWPKRTACQLIVKSAGGSVRFIKNDTELFAWLYEYFDVSWRASPGVSPKVFFEFCRNNAEQFDDFASYPHFPQIERILYEHPEPLYADGEALDEFLNFFSPSTAEDRELIKAFVLTLFWGGEPGQRPAFLVTTDGSGPHKGVGAGKSILVSRCGELCGGSVSTSQTESIEGLKKRILSQAKNDSRPRVIELDNVKTRRFSSAELESLITSSQISGHVMYRGNGSVPNLHTVAITINGANLSKDLAQRCIVIILAESQKAQTWVQDLKDFIESNRWAIIGDIGQLLESEVHPLPDEGSTRWAAWEYGVLSRVDTPETVRTLIQARQGMLDDDDANGDEFIKHIQENLGRFKIYPKSVAKILHDDMHTLLKEFFGEPIGKNVVTKKIEAMGLQCLHRISKPGKARVWLFRTDGKALTPEQISAAMSPPAN